jgi:hypothetical protein
MNNDINDNQLTYQLAMLLQAGIFGLIEGKL